MFIYSVAGENTSGMCCCVTTPDIFTAVGIPPRLCTFSVCVPVCTRRLVCIAVRCSGSNLWANTPVQSCYDTAVTDRRDDIWIQIQIQEVGSSLTERMRL